MSPIIIKVLDLLDKNLTQDELLELHERIDSDSQTFFVALAILAASKVPENFIDG